MKYVITTIGEYPVSGEIYVLNNLITVSITVEPFETLGKEIRITTKEISNLIKNNPYNLNYKNILTTSVISNKSKLSGIWEFKIKDDILSDLNVIDSSLPQEQNKVLKKRKVSSKKEEI